jgi:hypothetical protein
VAATLQDGITMAGRTASVEGALTQGSNGDANGGKRSP